MGASPHTIAAYRDTFRLFLRLALEHLGKTPSKLRMEDLDVTFVSKLIDHLENKRGNSTRTRNNWLAALHSFFQFVAIQASSAENAIAGHHAVVSTVGISEKNLVVILEEILRSVPAAVQREVEHVRDGRHHRRNPRALPAK